MGGRNLTGFMKKLDKLEQLEVATTGSPGDFHAQIAQRRNTEIKEGHTQQQEGGAEFHH